MGSFSLVVFIARLFEFYQLLVLIWCIMSWLPMPRGGLLYDVAHAIDSIVRPYIQLFQRFIPPFGGLDFSPIVAIFVLQAIERVIMGILL